jgi:hypothetical protein
MRDVLVHIKHVDPLGEPQSDVSVPLLTELCQRKISFKHEELFRQIVIDHTLNNPLFENLLNNSPSALARIHVQLAFADNSTSPTDNCIKTLSTNSTGSVEKDGAASLLGPHRQCSQFDDSSILLPP